jgi:hypothetical protein
LQQREMLTRSLRASSSAATIARMFVVFKYRLHVD